VHTSKYSLPNVTVEYSIVIFNAILGSEHVRVNTWKNVYHSSYVKSQPLCAKTNPSQPFSIMRNSLYSEGISSCLLAKNISGISWY
jgi:hypothetical protein